MNRSKPTRRQTPSKKTHSIGTPISYPPPLGTILHSAVSTKQYRLQKKLASGGRSHAFIATEITREEQTKLSVVKIPNLNVDSFPFSEIRTRIQSGTESVRNELLAAKNIQDVSGISPMRDYGTLHCTLKKTDGTASNDLMFFSAYEFAKGDTLDKWAKRRFAKRGAFKGIPDQLDWFRIATALLKIMENVHHQRVVHSDLWPPNVLIDPYNDSITIIDFGEAWELDELFDQGGRDDKMHPYLAPERWTHSRSRRWYTPSDIYSLGGLLHYLATGQSPIDPRISEASSKFKSNEQLKSEIAIVLKAFNPKLYSANRGVVDIILLCRRPGKDRAPNIRQVLDAVEIFRPSSTLISTSSSNGKEDVVRCFEQLKNELNRLKDLDVSFNPAFQKIVSRKMRELTDEIRTIDKKLFIVDGDRESLINGILLSLDVLKEGDAVFGLTSCMFWYPGNCGPNGRVMTQLLKIASAGVQIKWVILTERPSQGQSLDVLNATVIEYQAYAMREALEFAKSNSKRGGTQGGGIEFRIVEVDAAELDSLRRQRNTAVLLRHSGNWTLLAPDYSSRLSVQDSDDQSTLSSVRIWASPNRQQELFDEFKRRWDTSESIAEWKKRKSTQKRPSKSATVD